MISIFATWKTIQLNETQVKLNKLLTVKEEAELSSVKKAEVSANFLKLGNHQYRLKVFNKGKNLARNVTVSFPDAEELPVNERDLEAKFPISLEPHQAVEVIASIWGPKRKYTILIEWADEFSENNSKKLDLTV